MQDRTNKRILITALPQDLQEECTECILILSCVANDCTADSIAAVKEFSTSYTVEPNIFPVYVEKTNKGMQFGNAHTTCIKIVF